MVLFGIICVEFIVWEYFMSVVVRRGLGRVLMEEFGLGRKEEGEYFRWKEVLWLECGEV